MGKRKKIHAAWIWIFSLSTGCLAIALITGSTCRDSFHKGFVLSLFGETGEYTYMDAIRDLVDLGAGHGLFEPERAAVQHRVGDLVHAGEVHPEG